MRLVGISKRDKRPRDEPPPWLLPLGVGGVAVTIIGRVVDGAIGQTLGDVGCGTTVFGALVFFGLMAEWLSPRKRGDEE